MTAKGVCISYHGNIATFNRDQLELFVLQSGLQSDSFIIICLYIGVWTSFMHLSLQFSSK